MFGKLDAYERKARLLPATIVMLPLIVAAMALTQGSLPWYATLGSGVGLGAALCFGLSYFAGAAGRHLEAALWQGWGGPPTTRWLRPTDRAHSEAQKARWRVAIRKLTGLTVPASVKRPGEEEETDRAIGDAVLQLRHRLRDHPAGRVTAVHNIDYGFYRNLSGLRGVWAGCCGLGVAACSVASLLGHKAWIGLGFEASLLAASALSWSILPAQIRRSADRYAESLFTAALLAAEALDDPDRPTAGSGDEGRPRAERARKAPS